MRKQSSFRQRCLCIELVTYKQGPDGVNIWAGCSLYRGKRIFKGPQVSICFMFRDQPELIRVDRRQVKGSWVVVGA